MGAQIRKDLFLQVSADVSPLKTQAKVGQTALLELGNTAGSVADAVEKAFAEISTTSIDNQARAMTTSLNKTLSTIRQNAQAAIDAPDGISAVRILDAAGAQATAANAGQAAAALRVLADAAAAADRNAGGADAALRTLAIATEVDAVEAERYAVALRDQATALSIVQHELAATTGAQTAHVQGTKQVTVSAGQQRAGLQQLGFQINDVATQFSSGTPPMQIFAQQGGQVVQSLQLMTNKTTGLLGFLGGPWGAVLTAATLVAVPFIAQLVRGKDALGEETDKLKENAEKADIAERAKKAFAASEAGVIDDVHKLTEELRKQNDELKTNAERQNVRARNELKALQTAQAADKARLADLNATPTKANYAERLRLQGQITERAPEIAGTDAAYQQTRADLAGEAAERAIDPMARIKRLYDDQVAAAKAAAVAEAARGKAVDATLTAQLAGIAKARAADIKKEQDRQAAANHNGNNNDQGRIATVADATAIIQSIGGRVTSGLRSRAEQERIYADKLAGRHKGPVAKPGTSDHETGDAIDVAFGPGISSATIHAAFAKQGVAIHQFLTETAQGVFHVGFNGKGKAAPSAETIANKAQNKADEAARNAEAYQQDLARAKVEQLQLIRSQTTDIAAAADLDAAAVIADRDRQKGRTELDVTERKITQAQADALIAINAKNAELKIQAIRQGEATAVLDRQLSTDRAALDAANATLRLDLQNATTLKQRRAIALRLFENDQQAARDEAFRKVASADPGVRAQGMRDFDDLDANYHRLRKGVANDYAGPLDTYREQLKKNVGDIDTALQGVAVHGLASLEDGLTGVINGTESVAGAFKKMASSIVADLARIAIEKAIVGALGGSSFFGLKLAGGGKVESKAGGGIIRGAGTGTSDSILALIDGKRPLLVSNGESVVTADATRRYWPIIDAMNKGTLPGLASGGVIGDRAIAYRNLPALASIASGGGVGANGPVTITLVVRKGEAFDAEVLGVSVPASIQVLQANAPALMDAAASHTISKLRQPSL